MEGYTKITLALTVTSVTRCDKLVTTIWLPEYKLLDISKPEAHFIRNCSVPSEILQTLFFGIFLFLSLHRAS